MVKGFYTQMKNTRWFDAISKLTTSVVSLPCIGARASSFLKIFHNFIGIDRRVNGDDNSSGKGETGGETKVCHSPGGAGDGGETEGET